jgi:hypothetical protein
MQASPIGPSGRCRSRHCGGRGATLSAAAGFCAEMCACRSGLIPRLWRPRFHVGDAAMKHLSPTHFGATPRLPAILPNRPDARVLHRAIPLFFIGRNKNGFWLAREARGGSAACSCYGARHCGSHKTRAHRTDVPPWFSRELSNSTPGTAAIRWPAGSTRRLAYSADSFRTIRRRFPLRKSIGKGIGFSVGPTRRRLVASGSWSFKKMSAYMPCLARGRRLVSNSHTPIGIFGADDPCSCTSSHDAYQRTLAAGTSRQSPDRAGFSEVAAGNLAALVRIHV